SLPYHFETKGPADWMSRYFFTADPQQLLPGAGGTMPSMDLLLYFQDHLALQSH
ncbi:uncharacterized protein HaLaN_31676, partial [Haematococcus lacustris]